MEAEIDWKITWHCCISCNPAKGRVDFEDGGFIKSSFITKEQIPTTKKKIIYIKHISEEHFFAKFYYLLLNYEFSILVMLFIQVK